jgi:MFS family permease
MSWITLAPVEDRPGHLACACDVALPPEEGLRTGEPALGVAMASFACTVLCQALTGAVLPMAGHVLAQDHAWAPLPFALTLVGAATATLPAALLSDTLGRQAGLALGASLGLAGGCLAAWGFATGHFSFLALGSFWLGLAQGFGFFHRHGQTALASNKSRAVAFLLGSGCLAALLAPVLLTLALDLAGPLAPAVALVLAGATQLAIMALALAPGRERRLHAPVVTPAAAGRGRVLAAAAMGAMAWFGMTWLMAGTAPLMAACGLGAPLAAAVIAWHVLWMYAPAALAGRVLARWGGMRSVLLGLVFVSGAVVLAPHVSTFSGFAAVLALGGSGWSSATFGTTLWLHAEGRPSPRLLALHDGLLFAGAVAGALL